MSGRYQAYPEYKDSGVEWLEAIPSHWDIKKLKFIANVQPSNVDKKTNESETPVLLCNYTDVYYNDTVNAAMEFMKASATEEQIKKFTLQAGDTIITKDSEDPDDIAIPTFVPEDMVGAVCGYHLSIIRPYDIAYGKFIKRLFECCYARAYFATRSNGLTRYGLGTYALENVFYPKPPEIEATTIANFLDHETAKIDTLIEKQQQLIKLLKEKRQAVISHAVTKGLNPNVTMRDSGVKWLGEVPEHWDVCKLKHIISSLESGVSVNAADIPAYGDELGVLKTSCVYTRSFRVEENKTVLKEEENRVKCPIRKGAIIISRMNTPDLVGASALVEVDDTNIYLPDRLWQTIFASNIKLNPKFILKFRSSKNTSTH